METVCYLMIIVGVATISYWITKGLCWFDQPNRNRSRGCGRRH